MKENFMMKNFLLNTILFSDYQVIMTSIEDDMMICTEQSVYALNNVAIKII
jgi:hypothetical protein